VELIHLRFKGGIRNGLNNLV